MIEIFRKDKKVYLNYKRNNIDCNKVDEIYGAKLSLIKEIEISNQQKKVLMLYVSIVAK